MLRHLPLVVVGLFCLGLTLLWAGGGAAALSEAAQPRIAAIELWVDPLNGNDSAGGATRTQALRTITAAWNRIPSGAALTSPYTIQLVAGDYADTNFPGYWEERYGTAAAPITLRSADGPRTAQLQGNVNMYDVRHLALIDLAVVNDGDVFHCEQCRHLTLSNVEMDGGDRAAHETVKINQSSFITIEQSFIHGSYENAIDFVAVQHATIRNNRIAEADDWCFYVKGGSADVLIEGNEIYDCGTGGFTAGQGTGFEYMVSPWLHYEAYAVRVVNNLIHDTWGAGLGVNGGYDILLAHNTLYRVGERSHLLEFIVGLRSCDENAAQCAANNAAGGWGPISVGGEVPIPNRNVFVYNNLIVNPAGYQSEWQHLTVDAPRSPSAGSNVPSPLVSDENLRIVGNVIWNGPADHLLGVDSETGCRPANSTCNATQLAAENAINTLQPLFADAAGGDFQLTNAGSLPVPAVIPDFPAWLALTPAAPAPITLVNTVSFDFAGRVRSGYDQVGALAAGSAPLPTATPGPSVQAYLPFVTLWRNPTATPVR